MALILKPNETCPYVEKCPFSNTHDKVYYCRGTYERSCTFVCELIRDDGTFLDLREVKEFWGRRPL